MTTLRNALVALLVLQVAACMTLAQEVQPLRPLPTLHGSHVEIVQWAGDEEKLTEWARVTGTLTPTGQNPVKEECELGAKIQAATGCKTIFALYAFDEGKFPEDVKPWEYATGEWWEDHLDETFLRLQHFTQWSGGRPPDYLVISTELRQWQRYSRDPRYAAAIKDIVAQVVRKTKRYAPDALITPYAHGQFNFGRDGWRYRSHPWPKGTPWPCVVAQLYEPKHALMLSATAAKSWEYAQEQGLPMAAFVSIAYDYRFDFGLDGTNPNAWGRTFDARLTPHEVHRVGQLMNVRSRWPSGNTIGTDGLFEYGNVEIKYIFHSPTTLLKKHPDLWPVLWAEYNRGAHLQPPSPNSAFDGLWSDN